MSSSSSSLLFTPIRIRHLTLPNRFLMSPLYLNAEHHSKLESDDHMKHMATFYSERAKHGAKLIVCGGIAPSVLGRWKAGSLSLTTWDTAQKLERVTSSIHENGGAVLAQAFHAGRSSFRRIHLAATSAKTKVHPYQEFRPIPIPGWLVNYVVSEYERFARLAEAAGFDGVEIPLSEGSLLHNFVSSATNNRHDEFGGSIEQRMEIVLRVLANIRNGVQRPDQFAVTVRLCVHDLQPGGNSMSEIKRLAEVVGGSGVVDLITTSVGMHDSPVQNLSSQVPQGTFSHGARIVRSHLHELGLSNVPVAASHRITSRATAERLLANGYCDMIGVGRALLADSQFIEKLQHEKDNQVVPCIGCNHCVNKLYKHLPVGCAVNPRSGYEWESWRNAPRATMRKNVAVVGAGAAGITCALTLSARGHNVVLYERSKEIGGQLNLAKVIPGKDEYYRLLEYWTYRLRESTVKVRLQADFTREEVSRSHQNFHAVVLTTGSILKKLLSNHIPGASECANFVPFERILDGSVCAGRRVVILGNGAIAADVASYLLHDQRVSRNSDAYCVEWGINLDSGTVDTNASATATRNNRDVIILQRVEKDSDLSRGRGWAQKLWLKNHGASVIAQAMPEKIDPDGIQVSLFMKETQPLKIFADTIVNACGMLPNITVGTWIYEWVKDGAETRGQISSDFGIYAAGTCRDSITGEGHGEQDLMQVIHEGYEIGCKV